MVAQGRLRCMLSAGLTVKEKRGKLDKGSDLGTVMTFSIVAE
jgi:hypothetical protein